MWEPGKHLVLWFQFCFDIPILSFWCKVSFVFQRIVSSVSYVDLQGMEKCVGGWVGECVWGGLFLTFFPFKVKKRGSDLFFPVMGLLTAFNL